MARTVKNVKPRRLDEGIKSLDEETRNVKLVDSVSEENPKNDEAIDEPV